NFWSGMRYKFLNYRGKQNLNTQNTQADMLKNIGNPGSGFLGINKQHKGLYQIFIVKAKVRFFSNYKVVQYFNVQTFPGRFKFFGELNIRLAGFQCSRGMVMGQN